MVLKTRLNSLRSARGEVIREGRKKDSKEKKEIEGGGLGRMGNYLGTEILRGWSDLNKVFQVFFTVPKVYMNTGSIRPIRVAFTVTLGLNRVCM